MKSKPAPPRGPSAVTVRGSSVARQRALLRLPLPAREEDGPARPDWAARRGAGPRGGGASGRLRRCCQGRQPQGGGRSRGPAGAEAGRGSNGGHGGLGSRLSELVPVSRGAIRHLLHRTALAASVRAPPVPAAAASGALGPLAAVRGPAQLAR